MLEGSIRTYHREKRYLRQTGEIIWVGLNVAAQHDQHGQLCNFITEVEDIRRRKEAEQELWKHKVHLEAFVAALDEIVFEFDADGVLSECVD